MIIKRSATGGVWLIAMIIYFILLIGLTVTSSLTGETQVSQYETSTSEALDAGGICANPRGVVDPDTREYWSDVADAPFWSVRFPLGWTYGDVTAHLSCEYSYGTNVSDACVLEGCTWNGTSSKCEGLINASYYGFATEGSGDLENIINDFGVASPDYWLNTEIPSPCDQPSIRYNESLCEAFTCRWVPKGSADFIEAVEDSQNVQDKFDEVKTIFNFSDLSFDTGSSALNWLLNFIFYIIPSIILVIALYFTIMPGK